MTFRSFSSRYVKQTETVIQDNSIWLDKMLGNYSFDYVSQTVNGECWFYSIEDKTLYIDKMT